MFAYRRDKPAILGKQPELLLSQRLITFHNTRHKFCLSVKKRVHCLSSTHPLYTFFSHFSFGEKDGILSFVHPPLYCIIFSFREENGVLFFVHLLSIVLISFREKYGILSFVHPPLSIVLIFLFVKKTVYLCKAQSVLSAVYLRLAGAAISIIFVFVATKHVF